MAKHLDRWGDRLTNPSLRVMRPSRTNIVVDWDGDTVYSYGRHFPLAHVQRTSPDAPAHLVILNGDRYSVTTAQHQSKVREAVRVSGVPSVTIPFTALRAAGIVDLDSIRLIDSLHELWVPSGRTRTIPWNELPDPLDEDALRSVLPWYKHLSCIDERGVTIEYLRHRLGESLISAVSRGRRRRYLSGFDRNERRDLYYLAELPRCRASTIDEALEVLKPEPVKVAERLGRTVQRQGDIFAIPMPSIKLRDLVLDGGVTSRRTSIMGTAHTATDVVTMPDGVQYIRGCMYHDPSAIGQSWRERDHARRKLGDGKVWHVVARNTVPVQSGRRATALR